MFPEGSCECGADLAGAGDLGVRYSHQVTDLPEAQAETTQYDRHEVACACGRTQVADAPPEAAGAPGTVTYGLNVQAWCVFLLVMHHVPVERCADIIASMSGTRPVRRVGARAAGPRCPGGRRGEHGDPGADHPRRRDLRGRDPAARRAGPEDPQEVPAGRVHEPADLLLPRRPGPGLLQGLRLYRPARHRRSCTTGTSTTTPSTGISHQLCTQHLLRDLEDAAQTYPGAIWPGQIAEALRGLIHAANLARDQGLAAVPAEMTAEHLTLFRRGVAVGLSQIRRVPGAKSKQPPARLLLECLRHREADVLRFLSDTAIPTDQQPGRTRPAAIKDPWRHERGDADADNCVVPIAGVCLVARPGGLPRTADARGAASDLASRPGCSGN